MLKKIRLSFVCLMLGLLMACDYATDEMSNATDSNALAQYQKLAAPGDWLLINYWAEWCPSCVEEIPELNEVHRQAGVSVVAVNYDLAEKSVLDKQATRMGIEYRVIDHDPARDLGYERPMALPTTIVIDPSGKVVKYLFGDQTKASILQTIRSLQNTAFSETD